MPYLVDTDNLIDYFRNNIPAGEKLDSMGTWSYSVMTTMELFAWAKSGLSVNCV